MTHDGRNEASDPSPPGATCFGEGCRYNTYKYNKCNKDYVLSGVGISFMVNETIKSEVFDMFCREL